jgi:hypothetical protein
MVYFLFFPSPYRFGRQAYNVVSFGFIGRQYVDCVKYEEGRFEDALRQLSAAKGLDLVEIDRQDLLTPKDLERFSNLLLKGQTTDVIRVVAQKS